MCDIPFIVYCISNQIDQAYDIYKQSEIYLHKYVNKKFSFKYEHNSCYCNSVLALLFSIDEIQNHNFFEDDPSIFDLHLAIIQYYIYYQAEKITSEYFRFMLTYYNFPFHKQNDAKELLAVLISESKFLSSIFKISYQLINFVYSKESTSTQGFIDIVDMTQTNGEILLHPPNSNKLGFSYDFNKISHTRLPPYFGVQFTYQYVNHLSQYIIVDFTNIYHVAQIEYIFKTKLKPYGGMKFIGSDKQGHYIYDMFNGDKLIRFNDMEISTKEVKERARYALILFKIENNSLDPQIHFKCNIATDWVNNQYSDEDKSLFDFFSNHSNKIQSTNTFRTLIQEMEIEENPLLETVNSQFASYNGLTKSFPSMKKSILDRPFTILDLYDNTNTNIEHLLIASTQVNDNPSPPISNQNSTVTLKQRSESNNRKAIIINQKQDNASTNQATHKTTNPSTNQATHKTTNPSTNQVTHKTTNPSTNQVTHKTTNPSTNQKVDNGYSSYYKNLYTSLKSVYANYVKSSKVIISNLTQENTYLKNKIANSNQFLDDFVQMLINMTERNKNIPFNNHSYTPEEEEKCFYLYIQNKIVYNSYRSHFIMPCLTKMKAMYKIFMEKMPFKSIINLDIDSFRKTIDYWIPYLYHKQKIPCILAIDAMCVLKRIVLTKQGIDGLANEVYISSKVKKQLQNAETFIEKLQIILNNHAGAQAIFVIQLIPLSNIKPVIVHFHAAPSGSATSVIYDLLEKELKCLRKEYEDTFICYGGAADADPQYRQIHDKNLSHWEDKVKSNPLLLASVINNLSKKFLFSPDLTHLTKRLKYRVQTSDGKTLYLNNNEIYFDRLLVYFQGNKAKYEYNNESFTKMDDNAVHNFFTPLHLLNLLTNKQFLYLESMLPATILNVIFYDPIITRTDRIQALLIGFFFVFYLYEAIKNKTLAEVRNPNFKLDDSCMTLDQMEDYLNLSIQVIKILHEVEGSFSMSRLGTLDNEHLFSAVREFAYHDETLTANIRAIKRLIALRMEDEVINTKRSHSKYPPAIVEPQIGDLNDQMVINANSIAQYLLIENETINIIPADFNILLSMNAQLASEFKARAIDTFTQMVQAWHTHYKYPKFQTTNGTVYDGHTPSANAQRRYNQNSHAATHVDAN